MASRSHLMLVFVGALLLSGCAVDNSTIQIELPRGTAAGYAMYLPSGDSE